MLEVIEQFINQIEEDQNFSTNTKFAYRGDLRDLSNYIARTNAQLKDINHLWVKEYLKYLEETNKERNSFNRRASTLRMFLKYLYKNRLAPTNYSLIVDNQTALIKTQEYTLEDEEMKKIFDIPNLKIDQKLIILLISKLGLSATQLESLNIHQIDFENKTINISDTEKIKLSEEVFFVLREYVLNIRTQFIESNEYLNLLLNASGKPITEADVYKLIKNLSSELGLEGKLTTRTLKKLAVKKIDLFSMQKEVLSIIEDEI